MKVLFAVNNDKISEAVIKKYPKEYKELLSYKNVYYFNAILKEIQNDKSYDRIVISEDLEPFVNTNHDSIDNFLFNHLDKISDEAQGNDGREMSIILICSERRTFGSNILSKLFSIGIYNALIGNDRSMDNLCKLINRPRNKKEAKLYYKIDQATYESAVDIGEVSETEIQNILNHFKKLGKSTERYTDSFNNIAAQYTDDQLKLIINVLPIKVKAVLEAESEKYQSIMGTSGEDRRASKDNEPGISVNTIGSNKQNNISGPIVIPSGVKKTFDGTKPIIPSNMVSRQKASNVIGNVVSKQPNKQVQAQQNKQISQSQQAQIQQNKQISQNIQKNDVSQKVNQKVNPTVQEPIVNQIENRIEDTSKNSNQQESINNQVVENTNSNTINNNGQRYTGTIAQVKRTLIARRKVKPSSIVSSPVINNEKIVESNIDDTQNLEKMQTMEIDEVKRGRGRPKKIVKEEEVKPKGKRGRPRKNILEEDSNLDEMLEGVNTSSDYSNDSMLPGLEDDNNQDTILPGIETNKEIYELENNNESSEYDSFDDEEISSTEDSVDSTFEPDEGEEVDVNSLLAGLDEDDGMLPGLDGNDENDGMLPGLDGNDENDGMLPGLDGNDEDDGMLPGLDGNDEDDGMLPGLDGNDEDDGMLPGLDGNDEDDGMLPGLDGNDEDDGMLPGLDESNDIFSSLDNDEETLLPGMGFEDEGNTISANSNSSNNAIESIKPQIDYSMSNLNSLLSKDKKIVAFVGATKNGTSFLINNLALMFSMMGIDTAILDMTQNKNSYYLFTDSREELRKIAYTSINKLENGYADGIKFNKNLTVYTGLPSDGVVYENAEPILSTLVQNHSLVLIDTDFSTPPAYFASSQEIYLVQSMDILTIQPLTAFLRDLKFKGAWEPEKARVVINKEVPIKILNNKTIIGGMSRYNGPDMSVMTELFNKDMVKACSIPFDEKVYAKYLETLATCKLSISSLPKQFRTKLQILGEMVYPRLNSKTSYSPNSDMGSSNYNNGTAFSNNTNNILDKMKKKF